MIIPEYPDFKELSLSMRGILHPLFHSLEDGISEYTFANIYLFRDRYSYKVSHVSHSQYILTGEREGKKFFLLPFGLPKKEALKDMFAEHGYLKLVSESIAQELAPIEGFTVEEDRDNFDYLYLREKLANLDGRKLHKKRNLVNVFVNNYSFVGRTLWSQNKSDALSILDGWRTTRDSDGDYHSTKEAIEHLEELGLHGSIVYVDSEPAGFTIGEELMKGKCFAIHFEKAFDKYKGIYQFMNKCFSSLLSEKYQYINREQDLGDAGLRQAKESYKPIGFVKKYIVHFKP
jgi:uncharacterized protein